MSEKFTQAKRGPLAKPKVWLLILLLIANATALVLVWEQPDCAASMSCPQTPDGAYITESIPELLGETMAHANWYCHECETYGGGVPNNMTMQEHIDFAHDGGIAEMEQV